MKTLTETPTVKVGMLIRRPPEEVFQAFVDPAILSRFWLSSSTGRLEAGKQVRWDFVVAGASAEVRVKAIEENQRIVIEFEDDGLNVEWTFEARGASSTYVTITNSGFTGEADDIVKTALDSTEGFTIVLCNLKGLLEHGLELNLCRDKFPGYMLR